MSRGRVKCVLLAALVLLSLSATLSLKSSDQQWLRGSTAQAGQASSPDLVISSISNPPTSVVAGTASISITDTTGNSGDGSANPSTTRYRLSTDNIITSADILLSVTRSISTLKKNSSSTGTVWETIPANFPPGTYYLGACADDLSVISETSETNNCRASTSTVQIYPPTSLTVAPTTVSAGGSVSATWTQLASPTSRDWLGLYVPGSPSTSYLALLYVNCTSTPTVAVPAGSCPFTIPFGLTPGTYELRINWDNGFSTRAISNSFSVTAPPPAAKLGISSVNGGTNPIAGTPFPVTVQVQGADGTPTITSSATNVSLALNTGTGKLGGTLAGTIPANTSQITINGLTYTKAESGVILRANHAGGGLSPGDSAPFTVNAGAPAVVRFTTQPGNSNSAGIIPGPPAVGVQDSLGNFVTSPVSVTITLGNNPAGAVLSGTTTKNTSAGIATFDNLSVDKSGNGYALIGTSGTLPAATSNTFLVSPAIATSLAFATQPINGTTTGAIPGPPTVVVRDGQGNTVTNSSAPITIAIGTNPGGGTLSGTTIKNAAGGASAFADLKINQAGNGYTLTATSPGISSATTTTFNITSSGSVTGTVSKATGGGAIAGASLQARQAGVVKGTASTTSSGGYTISGLAPGTYDIRADAGGFSPQTQSSLTISAGGTTTANFSLASASATAGIVYVYDELQRLKSVIDPIGEAATYSYDAVGNLLSIARNNSSQTSIIDFNPNSGPAGSTVTIHGTGYSATPSQNSVTFNGVAAPVISSTLTQITTTVPVGATSGPIAVTSTAGGATSATAFTVNGAAAGAPTIASFNPNIGGSGTAITISGTNFSTTPANNEVRFNPTLAVVANSSATNISTSFPVAGQSGKISVTTAGGTAVSSQDFFALPTPYVASDVEMTGRIVTGGSNQQITIAGANKIAAVIFDGVAGQSLNLGITSNTFPGSNNPTINIYKPDRTLLLTQAINGTNSAIDFYVPTQGTYTIVIDPAGTNAGSLTLTLSAELNAGTVSINGASAPVAISRPGQRAFLTFTGSAGQNVSIAVSGSTFGGGGLCCPLFFAVYKPDGSVLANHGLNDVSAVVDHVLPQSGTYKILIDPGAALTGSLTFTLSDDVNFGSLSINGPPTIITTTRPGQRAFVTFENPSQQSVTFVATDITIGVPGNLCCPVALLIYKPDGNLLTAPGLNETNNAVDVSLTAQGTYKIVIDPAGTLTGNLTLRLYNDQNAGGVSINGASTTVTISEPGRRAFITFAGTMGQNLSVAATNNSFGGGGFCCSTNHLIYKQDGSFWTSQGVTQPDQAYDRKLPETGTYKLVIDPAGLGTGSVTLTLSEDASFGSISDGQSVGVTIGRPGQRARLTFAGVQGDQVGIRASNVTITPCCSYITFLNPDDTQLTSKGDIGSAGGVLYTAPLGASGTYTILVDPAFAQTGDATISFAVENASLTAGSTMVPAGSSVTASWVNIPFPSPNDWLGLYAPGVSDSFYIASRFTDGASSSSVPFTIPSNLAPGTYELRLFPYQSSVPRLAISNTFTVTAP